jgi:hypothetical protein
MFINRHLEEGLDRSVHTMHEAEYLPFRRRELERHDARPRPALVEGTDASCAGASPPMTTLNAHQR